MQKSPELKVDCRCARALHASCTSHKCRLNAGVQPGGPRTVVPRRAVWWAVGVSGGHPEGTAWVLPVGCRWGGDCGRQGISSHSSPKFGGGSKPPASSLTGPNSARAGGGAAPQATVAGCWLLAFSQTFILNWHLYHSSTAQYYAIAIGRTLHTKPKSQSSL
jgi:hypothetical protein